ncbi:MAG: hypothetical protein K6G17_01785 [Oscillospiraceae bacterium]|nr:hypothetical protein [Oscillospiraceae bacterium]
MKSKTWIPHIILVAFNILILLSVWFSYADSHGMLSIDAMTDATIPNAAISIVYLVSFLIALIPYGCGVLILAIVKYSKARKAKVESKQELTSMLVAIPALLFTLASKYLFLMSIVAEILYPDSFHI